MNIQTKFSTFDSILRYSTAYRLGMDKPLIFEHYGSWDISDGLHDGRDSRILSRRRRDLRGQELIAPVVFATPGAENFTDLDDYKYNVCCLYKPTNLYLLLPIPPLPDTTKLRSDQKSFYC